MTNWTYSSTWALISSGGKMHNAKRRWRRIRSYTTATVPYFVFAAFAWLMYDHISNLLRIQSIRQSAGDVRATITEIETEQRGFLLSRAKKIQYLDYYRTNRMLLAGRLTVLCQKIPH